ncbi:Argonaute complex, subunit Arb1 [Aspergillus falconensis]
MERPGADPANNEEPTVAPTARKKKRKTRKPKSRRGKNKPTGFEEYYVDAPMTAEEYALEKSLYHISRPIIHRMEDALLRFNKIRRIESDRLEVFSKYLAYGGIDVSPKMFVGTDDRGLKELDNDTILLARGQTAIDRGRANLPIDFNAVVKGFLTSYFPFYFNPYNEDMIKLATVTIRSFLSYLLYHDVCPEYKENIDEARKSCDIATKELWKSQQLTANGPGDFNTACSILFGGLEHDLYVENNLWKNPKDDKVQMTKAMAQKVLRFGLTVAGSDELASSFHQKFSSDALTVSKIKDIHGFEVTEMRFLDDEGRKFYQDRGPDLNPVGILFGRSYCDPSEPEYDLSPEEREEWNINGRPMRELMFFLEESLLEHCYPGMKIITTIWEMDCGLHYFEEIIKAYSSIYTPLCNELMLGWKRPRNLTANDEEESGVEDGSAQPELE